MLNVALKAEDSRSIGFVGDSFKAEESFLSLVKRAKSSTLQTDLLQQQPRFYELIADEFNKMPTDFKVIFLLFYRRYIMALSFKSREH